jgi:pilus assembly protein CpaE
MQNIRIVIVDDSEETRNNIRQLLSFEKNFDVIGEAENGRDAIDVIKKLKPDIALMDINMPVMDGIRATEEITLKVPETTVIIVSVQDGNEYFRRAMTAGAGGYLLKPFSGSELTDMINSLCQKKLRVRKT